MDWVVESSGRRVKSSGAASFSYDLTIEEKTALIIQESSNVLERRTEYIPSSLELEESIRRSVWKFREVYAKTGMAGSYAEIKSCWRSLDLYQAKLDFAYCFGLDYVPGWFDDVAKQEGWPLNQFTTLANRARRVEVALARTKMARDDQRGTTEAWENFERDAIFRILDTGGRPQR